MEIFKVSGAPFTATGMTRPFMALIVGQLEIIERVTLKKQCWSIYMWVWVKELGLVETGKRNCVGNCVMEVWSGILESLSRLSQNPGTTNIWDRLLQCRDIPHLFKQNGLGFNTKQYQTLLFLHNLYQIWNINVPIAIYSMRYKHVMQNNSSPDYEVNKLFSLHIRN